MRQLLTKMACAFSLPLLAVSGCGGGGGSGADSGMVVDGSVLDVGTDAGPCVGDLPPVVTGSVAEIGFPIGSGTAAYMVTFDEAVTLAAGAITVDGGATLTISPALPATATGFMVTLSGLVDGTDYQLTLGAGAAEDACGNTLDSALVVSVVSGCSTDTTAPTIVSALDPIAVDFDATSATYTLMFDEMVALDAGAITASGGATLTVTPTLPAVGSTFTVQLTDVTDVQSSELVIVAASVADRCGNGLAADATLDVDGVCLNDSTAPSVTSSVDDLAILPGETSVEYTLTFDEVVALGVDAIAATGGATVTVDPPLPSASDTFTVTLSDVSPAMNYVLTVDAAHAADRCEVALAASIDINVLGGCVGNVAPTATSLAVPRQFSGDTYTHVLTFDEPVLLNAGAITVDQGAGITVTPALPALATSFEVVLSGLTDGTTYTLDVDAGEAADVCGAMPVAGQSFTLDGCGGVMTPPTITSDTTPETCTLAGSYTYTLELDQITYVQEGEITATGGTITSITPALPAYASSFEVVMDLAASNTISVNAGVVGDCGGATTAASTATLTAWVPQTMTFTYTGAVVAFEVPASDCPTTIEAWGAQGSYNTSSGVGAGLGARMRGTFTTLPSRSLLVLVGEQANAQGGNGGGGGSFVVTSANVPLVIAGGGGGSGQTTDGAHKHGSVATSGQTCPANGGVGGVDGNGGAVGASGFQSGAGGGLLTAGANGWTAGTGGASFLGGGIGGNSGNSDARGGFGGGGAGSSYVVGGGGGGYSGGAGCGNEGSPGQAGAGGGSYNAAPLADQDNQSGVRAGHGQVTITW